MLHRCLFLILLLVAVPLLACQPPGAPDPTSSAGNSPTPKPPPLSATPGPASGQEPITEGTPAPQAGNADVEQVRAVEDSGGTWTFHVTVRHPDTGWEDYADGWDVVTSDGTILKPDPSSPFTRLLLHPHENEQPFTRSQSGLVIPEDVTQVRVRAHDLMHGYGGREVLVDLTLDSGPGFTVERRP